MKKTLILTLTLAFAFTMAAPVFAADLPRSADKIVKGATEVVKSPLALVKVPTDSMKDHDSAVIGLFKGLIKAPFHTIEEAGDGLLKMATFPIK